MEARRIAERVATAVPRLAALRQLDEQIAAGGGRRIALLGAAGSGLTTLLCMLAAQRPYAIWLPTDDAGAGLMAACAQVLALGKIQPALLPPAAGRDTITLERLLAEAGAARPAADPLVLLLGRPPDDQAAPLSPRWPAQVPPGVVLIQAAIPSAAPLPPHAAVRVGNETEQSLAAIARAWGSRPEQAEAIASKAEGSPLFARLAAGLCQAGVLTPAKLPTGMLALQRYWWEKMDATGRQLAMLLAASAAPLAPELLAEIAGSPLRTVERWLQRWEPFFELVDEQVQLYHPVTRAFVRAQRDDDLAEAHGAFVRFVQKQAGDHFAGALDSAHRPLIDALARHAALATPAISEAALPVLATRSWAVARERQSGTLRDAAGDIAWVLRASASGDLLRLVRHATLAGVLAHLGRQIPADAPAEVFEAAVAAGGAREPTLRRVREILAQVPDGHAKAQALRRLGEVCYAHRMRASAMRMLSEALDLETPGPSRQWRDEREETLAAFARAAMALTMPSTALGIATRIGHAERRGMVETEVVRWLLARGERTRAEEVAYAIGHAAMHEWAMAEVAVGHARAGDSERGETVLSTLKTETAIAWARTELACDAARHGAAHAIGHLAPISNASLLDRALALVAPALAAGGHHEAALEAIGTAEDRAIRTRALIDLALLRPPNASEALATAAAELPALSGDERAPLVAELAAAQAMFGQLEIALRTAELLEEDEERDRAQSRVAVALARAGNAEDARIVAEAIGDDDERDWAFDELTRLAASTADWDEALALAEQIVSAEQRARTMADLALAQARAGYSARAHAFAQQIELPGERLRALMAIAEPLLSQGLLLRAEEQIAALGNPDQRSRYQGAVASALANLGELGEAFALAQGIARPLDQARALAAVARAAAPADAQLAQRALAFAFQHAAELGRAETLRCLEWAAPTLAQLGGVDLLLAAASAIDEIDSWWA